MGVIASTLRDGYFGIQALIADLSTSNTDFNALLERISKPSLPCSNPTVSFWQQNPIFPELVNIQSDTFPENADIVIIGSGVSGASIAYTVLTELQAKGSGMIPKGFKLVIFEARELCSGATGRNGGHIKHSPYYTYAGYKKRFGRERAKKLLQFERLAFPTQLGLAKGNGFEDAEAREVETLDIFADEDMWKKAKEMVKQLSSDNPEAAEDIQIYEAEDGCQKFGINPDQCYGILAFRAGAIWPYRLVTSIYSLLLNEFPSVLQIETRTPATSVETNTDSERPFSVVTPRGKITASHVIHATNAFATNLIPGMNGKLLPVRGHMTAQKPGTSFPDLNGSRSWGIVHKRGFDYVTQRPGSVKELGDSRLGGELMVGGGVIQSPSQGIDEFGIWNDDKMSLPITAYLTGLIPAVFNRSTWAPRKLEVKQVWSGTMGYTVDELPFVGKLDPGLTKRKVRRPGRKSNQKHIIEGDDAQRIRLSDPAEWISAGFNGEGMIYAWLSSVAVGLMVLGVNEEHRQGRPGIPEGKVSGWLPEELICTKKRVDRSSIVQLALLM
ncbi:hypothetical protein MW887_009320 [Aspergillus wentii]|nr:hypothetical protein MW887_009320 [Aspergillus wentii]